eukprot:TRINITY_DN111139_c0_g1_i1.p1 TRINITY_DN111139_c0_g1~~TRINITY_DN111139_c0_g1_i1.p1  ORF type:complete len:219 (+),score=39.82 TRINITY_DN111139_c0_g1_i1:139-795(+)
MSSGETASRLHIQGDVTLLPGRSSRERRRSDETRTESRNLQWTTSAAASSGLSMAAWRRILVAGLIATTVSVASFGALELLVAGPSSSQGEFDGEHKALARVARDAGEGEKQLLASASSSGGASSCPGADDEDGRYSSSSMVQDFRSLISFALGMFVCSLTTCQSHHAHPGGWPAGLPSVRAQSEATTSAVVEDGEAAAMDSDDDEQMKKVKLYLYLM